MRKLLLKKETFYFITILVLLTTIGLIFAPFYKLHSSFWSHGIATILIFIFIFFHSIIKTGTKNAFVFLGLSISMGFISEFLGMRHGYIFGSVYTYSGQLGPKLLGVPILVILMWGAIIYVAYAISEHILDFRITKKISRLNKFYLAFSSSIVAALATVAWDFTLDPLAVANGWWAWQSSSAYFGIPAGNFIGWFIISFLVVFLFKMFFEYEHIEKETVYDYAPTLCYGLLFLSIVGLALEARQYIFILISFIAMFPFISIIVVRYFVMKTKAPHLFKHKHG